MNENESYHQNTDKVTSKYMIVRISEDKYCLPLKSISEVVPNFEISPVPLSPLYFKGLINLRGQVISVIDMGIKLGKKPVDIVVNSTCVVVFTIENIKIGALFDEVVSVESFAEEKIDGKTYMANDKKNELIQGVIKSKEELLFLIKLKDSLEIDEIKKLVDSKSA